MKKKREPEDCVYAACNQKMLAIMACFSIKSSKKPLVYPEVFAIDVLFLMVSCTGRTFRTGGSSVSLWIRSISKLTNALAMAGLSSASGFRHHVAITYGDVAEAIAEAFTKNLGYRQIQL